MEASRAGRRGRCAGEDAAMRDWTSSPHEVFYQREGRRYDAIAGGLISAKGIRIQPPLLEMLCGYRRLPRESPAL